MTTTRSNKVKTTTEKINLVVQHEKKNLTIKAQQPSPQESNGKVVIKDEFKNRFVKVEAPSTSKPAVKIEEASSLLKRQKVSDIILALDQAYMCFFQRDNILFVSDGVKNYTLQKHKTYQSVSL